MPKARKQTTKPDILIQLSNCTNFVFYYISIIWAEWENWDSL